MKLLHFLLSSLLLVGCSAKNIEPTVLVQPVYKAATFPDALLEPCVPTPPPDQESYISLNDIEKEDTLIQYSQHLLADINKCNSQIKQTKKIYQEYKLLFR